MEILRLRDILAWTGARPDRPVDVDALIGEISKNTQTLRPGALFVPLRGARFDGHDFISAAAQRGAAAALCSRAGQTAPIPLLLVEDTLAAVQALAAGYRARMPARVAGITGSVGKTTTAAMTACVLGTALRVAKTAEDMNGQIGLTFGIFALNAACEAAVWEMGMSAAGELSRLSRMAKPDIAVINSIGTAHIEFFGSRENILKAKLEILEGLSPDGTLVLNADEPLLWALREALPCRALYYGLQNPQAQLRGAVTAHDAGGQALRIAHNGREWTARLRAVGAHNAQNALAAAAVGSLYGLSPGQIAAGLASFESVRGRQRILTIGGMKVVEDCYNASPESVQAALGVLAGLCQPGGRRFAVLGGMRELGHYAKEAHRLCGAKAADCADFLFVYGEGAAEYLEGARGAGLPEAAMAVFDSHEALAARLAELARPGDALLFKGSRLMYMERALALFRTALGTETAGQTQNNIGTGNI